MHLKSNKKKKKRLAFVLLRHVTQKMNEKLKAKKTVQLDEGKVTSRSSKDEHERKKDSVNGDLWINYIN